jgi:hypothetical protein
MEQFIYTATQHAPWSKGKLVGHNQPVTSVRQISEKLPSTHSSIIQK